MANASVLIIEDSPELTVLYQKILSPLKCHVTTCATGALALDFLKSNRPRVIVADLTLPDMSTEVFFEHFIGVPGINAIPLILISGREDLSGWQNLFGAIHALKKPTDVIKFRECVKSLIAPGIPLEI